MKIALIGTPFIRIPPPGYGGTELFCLELATSLVARGHDVVVFTTGDATPPGTRRSLYPHGIWPMTAADELNHAAWACAEVERTRAFDVVHTNLPLSIPLSRFIHERMVHTIHHKRQDELSRIYAVHPDVTYVAISQRQLALETPLARSTMIHHGISPERYPASSIEDGYLLHLGRFAREKGTHLAMDVARRAGLPLLLAGRTHEFDEEYYATEILPRLRAPDIQVVGEVGHEQKLSLLRGARALLCPLQWEEPFGLAAIESMFCGTPVLGFARGSFPEIIDEGVTGFSVPSDDVDGMAQRAQMLVGFDRVGCATHARARFSAATMTDAYLALYERVARSRSRRAA